MKVNLAPAFLVYLVGFSIVLLNGLMFVLGTELSTYLYLVPLFIALGNVLAFSGEFRARVLLPVALLIPILSIVAIFHSTSTVETRDVSYVYARGFLIYFSVILCASLPHRIDTFFRGAYLATTILIFLSAIPLTLYFFDIHSYFRFGQIFLGGYLNTGYAGLFHNPNYWAIFVITSLPFLFYFHQKKTNKKYIFFALLTIASINLIASGSRMAVIGLGLALLIIFMWKIYGVYNSVNKNKWNLGLALPLLMSVFIIGLSLFYFNISSILEPLSRFVPVLESTLNRFYSLLEMRNDARLDRLSDNLEHYGFATAEIFFGKGLGSAIPVPHNSVLMILIELGLLVLLYYFVFLLSCVVKAKHLISFDRALAGYIFVSVPLVLLMSLTNDFIETRSFWLVAGTLTCVLMAPRHDLNNISSTVDERFE